MYNFSNSYNRDNFISFLENNFLPEDFELKEEKLNLNFSPKFTSSVTRLGKCKSLELEVFEVEHNSTHDARVGISRDAFQVMQKNSYCNRALVAFIPKGGTQYRFSYLQIDAELKDHSARIERNYSNPRRYSYLLGNETGGYTPNEFLLKKGRVKNKKDLVERFSVEILTKAFYQELYNWYERAIQTVKFPGEFHLETEDERIEHRSKNVIRLLTRLLFVWFLKQKNLIPNELFDIQFLNNELVKDFNPNLKSGLFAEKSNASKYYKAILQNLFFATLNCPITPQSKEDSRTREFRKMDWYGQAFGSDHLMRYEELFIKPELFLELVNAKVPFLNGGLFDCLDNKQDGVYIDGFSDNLPSPNLLIVPDFLFFGDKKNIDSLGLIDILQKYNFTVEENTPFDQEVSLDPELLGKVFENLLASYNPETKTTARKQTGSFYTPREVVQYMVNESLISHLNQVVGKVYEEEYRKLMLYSEEDLNLSNETKQLIIQAIQTCKVLDPACGSGAFPVGVLQQMVHILSQLDPKNEIWKSLILQESMKEISSTLKDYSVEERDEIQTDINRSFDDNINSPDYARKLYLIEKCIYGIDIQSIAVQVSKLRFFISLIVDQRPTTKPEDNFGIRPLPNLEAKFVAANSLIGLQKTKDLFNTPELEKLQEKLIQATHRIFGAKSNKTKNKYRRRVQELQSQIADTLEDLRVVDSHNAVLMQQWKMFDQNASSPFFDSEWMFGVKNGFDIVIGNPPYISTKGISTAEKKSYEIEFGFSDDTYNLFTFKGMRLTKENGSITYIIPKTFWTTQTKRNMRELILKNSIRYIFDTANPFDSVMVDTCIIQVVKKPYTESHKVNFLDGSKNLKDPIFFPSIAQKVYRETQNSVLFKPTEYNIKIHNRYGKKVKDLYDQWWDKIETSKKITQNAALLEEYRSSLKPGDVALLGCLTEGGQGLATANNGKYIAIRKSTKWAANITNSRPKKLVEVMTRYKISNNELAGLSPIEFLTQRTEEEIAIKFDQLKEKYGRDIFGQGYIYRLIEDNEIADVDTLTDDEKENGIDTSKNYYVPYDKGDKDGNRWYLETPFAIAWSKENVQFLKTNSGKKGQGMPVVRNPQFYFREGFCWNNILNPQARLLKAKIKSISVNDVGSMSLYSAYSYSPNFYIVTAINSNFLFTYYREFINCTVNIQINDIRQLPIIIPTEEQLNICKQLFDSMICLKSSTSSQNNKEDADLLENKLDSFVSELYSI